MKTKKLAIFVSVFGLFFLTVAVCAEAGLVPPKSPQLDEGAGIIKNKKWALVLGKALFYDQQVGSDGQSCASCHFSAGADPRIKNEISPGFNDVTYGPTGDISFGSTRSDTGTVPPGYMPSGVPAKPNYTLTPADMPLHRLVDDTDRDSDIITTTNDRISSQGSFDNLYTRTGPFRLFDKCGDAETDVFYAGPYAARQVEPRCTPTVVNAVFNHRNFWDGRATNDYNGVGVFGMRDIEGDPSKRLVVLNSSGKLELTYLAVENASLASQAMAPPVSEKEMSCNGRDFDDIGRKMLLKIPLLLQKIDAQDSVLGKPGPFGDLRNIKGRGLKLQYLYSALIQKAFDDRWWKAAGFYKVTSEGNLQKTTLLKGGYTQMALNFSMFWGVAIKMYEDTLISDQSEFDGLINTGRLVLGGGPAGGGANQGPGDPIDPLLLRGAQIFNNVPGLPVFADGNPVPVSRGAGCLFCHGAPTFSENTFQDGKTFTPFLNPATDVGVPGLRGAVPDIRDLGFANIGIRPVFSDLLLGGKDPYGNPLSFGRQYKSHHIIDPFLAGAITNNLIQGSIANGSVSKLEADGAAKIPTLRNVALTPPYFLWGGYPDLRQVMKVYNRGGNRRQITGAGDPDNAHGTGCTSGDNSGTGPDGDGVYPLSGVTECDTNTTGLMVNLGLSDCEAPDESPEKAACLANHQTVETDDLAALVRFLKSLTDPRVQKDAAPFDHPSLFVVNGHKEIDKNRDGKADDNIFELPAVGKAGYPASSKYIVPNAGDLFAPGMQARAGD